MSTIARSIRVIAGNIAPMLRYEPGIRPNFCGADHIMTAAIMAVIIAQGVNTLPSIYHYLDNRSCPYDRDTVKFLLDAYDGRDCRTCVWSSDKAGRYSALLDFPDPARS